MDDLEIFNVNSYYNAGESDADFYEELDFLSGVEDIDDYKLEDNSNSKNESDNLDFLDHIDFFKGVHDDMDFLEQMDSHDKSEEKVTPPNKKKPVQTHKKKSKKESPKDKCHYWINICCVIGTLCLIALIFIFSWKIFGPSKNTAQAAHTKAGTISYDLSASKNKAKPAAVKNNVKSKVKSKTKVALTSQNVLFLGNSRTLGLQLSGAFKNATYFAEKGLNVETSLKEKVRVKKEEVSLLQLLKEKKFDRIYIMLGTNELGWAYTYKFENSYTNLVHQIKKVQPDTKICLQSILPVTNEKSANDKIYNNKRINLFNKSVKKVAKETSSQYLNVAKVFQQSDGSLPKKASADGIHLNQNFCYKWVEYLKQNS